MNPGLTAWTFETPPHPLRVGLRLQTVDDTPRVLHDLRLSVTSAKGELIRVEALLWNGWSVTHWSDWHDERLDAASFDVALHVEEGTSPAALTLVHHWQR